MSEPELYYAEWLDSGATARWDFLKGFEDPCATIKTIGWLIYESDTTVTIAGSIAIPQDNIPDQANCFISIPKVSLKQFHRIKVSELP